MYLLFLQFGAPVKGFHVPFGLMYSNISQNDMGKCYGFLYNAGTDLFGPQAFNYILSRFRVDMIIGTLWLLRG